MVRSGLVCVSKKGICHLHETNKQIGVPHEKLNLIASDFSV